MPPQLTAVSGGVRLDVTGARQHHQLDHLDHLVVHLHQAGFGDATDMEELPQEDRWLLPPPCPISTSLLRCH